MLELLLVIALIAMLLFTAGRYFPYYRLQRQRRMIEVSIFYLQEAARREYLQNRDRYALPFTLSQATLLASDKQIPPDSVLNPWGKSFEVTLTGDASHVRAQVTAEMDHLPGSNYENYRRLLQADGDDKQFIWTFPLKQIISHNNSELWMLLNGLDRYKVVFAAT